LIDGVKIRKYSRQRHKSEIIFVKYKHLKQALLFKVGSLLNFRKFAPYALKGTLDFQASRFYACKKKLDISFQVTRFQMIFGEKEQSVTA